MLTCRELIDFLMDYVSGELPEAQRREFERHLGVCPPCVAFLDTYRKTIELEKQAMTEPVGTAPPLPEELVQAILTSRESANS